MKQDINFSSFCDAFPESRQNNFSYAGKRALFDYLEEYEDSTGQEIDLDVVALCCEYSEYEDLNEYLNDYSIDKENCDTEEEAEDDIRNKTTLIKLGGSLDDGFIIQCY